MLAYKISSLTMPEDGRFGSFQLEGLENIYFRFERQVEGYYLYPDFFKKNRGWWRVLPIEARRAFI
ncbi:hypothetical protein [Enterococcus cecorum]|uniref:hypothetical protein n=1 Tax=Enterococcus cecorum TaxID=44008 RepID=UPI001FAD1C6E|nr:hypothetical protein [Enterococcus cecorum]MCJ0537769.1 hypothetical protein [Enterococcus cecorum]MCJ0547077.1 hypothetical protein [Enterococcus cecorum]MCJ0551870.1 hypothetical protein [Enterococcus cecorum]MCJ0570386.1 hypothetical protein [Enterococcus cecorum]